jgi:hypothetical protein
MAAKPLTRQQLEEALRLVAAELDDMGRPPTTMDGTSLNYIGRWGHLQALLQSLLDPEEAAGALTVLRRHVHGYQGVV